MYQMYQINEMIPVGSKKRIYKKATRAMVLEIIKERDAALRFAVCARRRLRDLSGNTYPSDVLDTVCDAWKDKELMDGIRGKQ